MLSAIKHRLLSLLQLLLVITYIIFEELIWEGIAKPIYEAIHALKILQKVEEKLKSVNPSMILVLFVVLLVIVEAFGIYAGILFVSGQALLGLTLYIAKIPVAAFTFWLFRVTEDKLMQFGWFKWLYDWIMKAIDWIKACEMYKKTMERLLKIKMSIKVFKEKYFANKSPFIEKMKQLYKTVKASLKK
ncbi:MAG: hypothetical protein KJO45_07495 [Sulfurovum sp.]|nr:hypothetical protein [Sulfurovum sp.]